MERPVLFLLTREELSSALAVCGVSPSPSSPLAAFPLHPPSPGVTRFAPEVLDAVRLAANPSRTALMTKNTAGNPNWRQLHLLTVDPGKACAALTNTGDKCGFIAAASPAGLVAGLIRDAGIGDKTDLSLTLTPRSWAALLAVADALQSARARALEWHTPAWKPVLTAHMLEVELEKGLNGADTRRMVTAGTRVTPPGHHPGATVMTDAIGELEQLGLLRAIPRGYAVAEVAEPLLDSLSQLRWTSGFQLPSGELAASAFVGGRALVLAEWNPEGSVTLSAASAADLGKVILRLWTAAAPPPLPPPPAAKFCSNCGAKMDLPNQPFCASCGARTSLAEAAR